MVAVYIIVIFIATLSGSICGMGGGVIIKPLLDALSPYSVFQINLVSSLCVFSMALSSLIRRIYAKAKLHIKTAISASIGALTGGIAGEFIFDVIKKVAIASVGEQANFYIKIIQNSILAILLIAVLVYMLVRKTADGYNESKVKILSVFISCAVLGLISTFLGIGGGPINVCVLCLVMSADTKEVATYSLLTVMWAQVAKFIKIGISGNLSSETIFNAELTWPILLIMVIISVAGGIVGAVIYKRISSRAVTKLYFIIILLVIALNVYNIIYNGLKI